MLHVAIIRADLVREMLAGAKTIESRLSRARRAPFGCVQPGERIYFKITGGPFAATALVHRVDSFDNLEPADIRAIRRLYNPRIRGAHPYWHAKRLSRFASLFWLEQIQPISRGPSLELIPHWQPRSAWCTIPESMHIHTIQAA